MADLKSFLNIKDASLWASEYLNKQISESNISYLIQYGKVKKYRNNGSTLINGNDLNWSLSFDNLKESDTTKHVHRLHPYKGKYIPQLVEYFIDTHTDEFKNDIYFNKGD